MNKKQIEAIAENYVTFQLETNIYTSKPLNKDKISFPMEGLIKIRDDKDVFLQIKDIKIIYGVRL